ncbi:SgcJ/EcaC family oxidoreductase [Nocardia terpenica]|uniref:SgcJ/EcaC family oxidoreductase n=1 Tax=Nocardia terpenica TaxID=455432 RepID=UPI0018946406|nr:SgcJ/EcaC family oxidoreductase [Nocardia terpenica]MBF6061100.1 SgcJ/EcaC family oxidoreductase [Nocardia terpenica]MBF6105671.1 SgcJ/EcaC family oxidoreductase [Nocardia terpenica]MBF6112859.1 SgcJ/EcaC family oxidoreductase [Nocardia terpenica]MBF6118989.1 SgcJ/EcaC family oxidoreductase [Nocardia terpenica]
MTTNTESSALSEKAVRDVLRSAMEAWSNNDADAFTSFYAEDVSVVLPAGVYHKNRKEIRQYMAAGFAGPLKGSEGIDRQESVRILGEDAAVVVSLSGYRLPGESEVPPGRLRRATWVLAKENGRWLVKAYHNCVIDN